MRGEAVPFVYNTYLIIDRLRNSGTSFTIDDIADRLRSAIENDGLEKPVKDGFVWNSEVASLKRNLIPFFNYRKQPRRSYNKESRENSGSETESLLELLAFLSRKMASEGRQSTADSYMTTCNSLGRFLKGNDMALADVNRETVEDYARWLNENGVSASTQSFYLRTLRAGINYAVKEGIAEPDAGMFRNVNTTVLSNGSGSGIPFLSRETILRIAGLDLSSQENLDLARDLFMFGFYCHGMELTDIMSLTAANLEGDVLTYRRRGNGKEITLRLDPPAMAILKKYGDRDLKYLFPLKETQPVKSDKALKNEVSICLGKIGELAGLESLSFNMNIASWKHLLSQANLTGVLLGLQ